MGVIFDLRFARDGDSAASGDTLVTPVELAAAVRRPRLLASLLWGRRWDLVTVRRDAVARSGAQAVGALLAAFARAAGFAVAHADREARGLGRAALLRLAVADAVVATPRELWHTIRLVRAVDREIATGPAPGAVESAPASVTYLRTEPAIAFQGRYVGGAAAHTTGVINGLEDCGLDVGVFAPQRPDRINAATTVVAPRRIHGFVGWLTVTAYGEEIVRAAERRRADFVYQRYALGSYAGIDLARRLGVPLVLEFNGSEVWAERNWGRGKLPLSERLVRLEDANVRAATLVVVVSEILKEQVLEMGIPERRILVNPNGVDAERLSGYRQESPAAWRARLGFAEVPTVGFVGTFGFWHGVTVLPAIIEELERVRPGARWVLIGDGGLREEVAEDIRRRGLNGTVDMTGVVRHEQALELLAACDVCVSPHVPNPDGSRFFGSPTKLFEYMGLAKPIVASDLEQIGDVIEHDRTGLLCAPGDAEAAARAVARLLEDEHLRLRLGDAALEQALSQYSWSAHVRRILDALPAR